ncbi:MAG: NAD(P)/FAD-dependent oxidoreductase, partial [Patescibacteria group bacterium]
IGGGPAGMMAAGRAGELGKKVILLEKNRGLGAKLLITGKGRCNITNKTENWREFINKFGQNGRFLTKALNCFDVDKTCDFFVALRLPLKVEEGQRVFPKSDQSYDVLKALIDYLVRSKVEIKISSEVKSFVVKSKTIEKIILTSGEEIEAKNFVIAVGGKSYPLTGSNGIGYTWLKKMGHKIIEPRPALVPILIKEKFVRDLQGLSLRNVEISLFENEKLVQKKFGEALFTDRGMSGPIILSLSRFVERNKNYKLKIDFKPALDFAELDKRVQADFQKFNNKQFRNALDDLLPQKAIPVFLKNLKISLDKKVNLITREERNELINLLKGFELTVSGLGGWAEAIITTGGVDLKEVDPKNMKSKIIENLYLCGEILDLDGPTGGYNLQVCWSTGMLAGEVK